MSGWSCRHCATPLEHTFVDLGMSPPANAFLRADQVGRAEAFYPLRAYVCESCLLVQLPAHLSPESIFGGDYAYYSSYSDTWLEHTRRYSDEMVRRLALGPSHRVVELASNDGHLLRRFQEHGVPVLGIEPAETVAAVARQAGVPTLARFFGAETAAELVEEGPRADLVVGNNVLAHVPDPNAFVRGIKILLAPEGLVTLEFPHLLQLLAAVQFDTIYHEHFSYFSLATARRILASQGLTVFDVEEIPTHGGSLRIHARHAEDGSRPVAHRVEALLAKEEDAGLTDLDRYRSFAKQVARVKRRFLSFLIDAADRGQQVVAYGAAAKGNTLLNYCGVRGDLISYVVDRSPRKQGWFLPGTHLPVHPPERIRETQPDYVVILPWNFRDEIMSQMAEVAEWGGRFVTAIPEVRVHG